MTPENAMADFQVSYFDTENTENVANNVVNKELWRGK